MQVHEILNELRSNNGSNFKMEVLRKHVDNPLLRTVLKMAYDRVTFTYGITTKNVRDDLTIVTNKADIEMGLKLLRCFDSREYTGNIAQQKLELLLVNMHPNDGAVIAGILDRNLKINMGRSNINKVFPGLIIKPIYMRCGIFSEDKIFNPADWVGELTPKEIAKRDRERARKINPKGAYVQLKADGTYREFTMEDDTVSCTSRTGEEYTYPLIFKEMEGYPDGKYPGELTVRGVTDRAIANGMINSSNPPHKDIMVQFWDHITLEEYHNVTNKVKNTTPYDRRFRLLIAIIDEHEYTDGHISPIPYEIVNSVQEALKATAEWMKEGYEGSIYKDASALFRDGTNLQQLKLKLEITLSMRATGYVAGNKGSKNEAYFSAITFENDEKTIQGQIGVTTMTEKQRDWFHNNRSTVISSIIDVQCNDLTKGRNNDYYALSHPRFDERRSDVTETDTLERALELRDSAMMLGL